MKTYITSQKKLNKVLTELNLPQASSINEVVLAIINRDWTNGEALSIVKVSIAMVAMSYAASPAMFARQLGSRSSWKSTQSYLRGDNLYVVGSKQRIPITFLGRAVAEIEVMNEFIVDAESVPLSYKRNPNTITRWLQLKTKKDISFAIIAKEYQWKVVLDKKGENS